jgi:hypothetical protein
MSNPIDKKLLQAINKAMKLSNTARSQPLNEVQNRELLEAQYLIAGLSGRVLLPAFEQWYCSALGGGAR